MIQRFTKDSPKRTQLDFGRIHVADVFVEAKEGLRPENNDLLLTSTLLRNGSNDDTKEDQPRQVQACHEKDFRHSKHLIIIGTWKRPAALCLRPKNLRRRINSSLGFESQEESQCPATSAMRHLRPEMTQDTAIIATRLLKRESPENR